MSKKIKDFVALKQMLVDIIGQIRTLSGCQSVGIRLHNNGDYPYYVHEGFPSFFIQKENTLYARDKEGKPILDEGGNPFLECMCGNVLQGRFDPKLVYFTEKGSFWTNSTTRLLTSVTEKDLGRTRNMCNYSGYESVALIPMRVGNKTLGLIQLDDPREDMFSPETIENYESLADHVGAIVFNALEIQKRMNDISSLVGKFKRTKN